jgi:hypothetical protein
MPRMSGPRHPAALAALALAASATLAACGVDRSADYYAGLEARLLAKGKLRTDTAPTDISYDRENLIRNFERVALHHEADATRPGSEGNSAGNPLKRWEGPLRYAFAGQAVTEADRAEVATLMRRIAELTGLEIAETEAGWNFLILITNPEERDHFSFALARADPGLAATFNLWRHDAGIICVANDPFSHSDGRRLSDGLVSIGSETTGVLRRACLHEEVVQSLGLPNDHPEVRPSIFNDDGEFALMTEHDEKLLRILYDPRLRSGMTADEAMPIVRQIVDGLPLDRPAGSLAARMAAPSAAGEGDSLAALGSPTE